MIVKVQYVVGTIFLVSFVIAISLQVATRYIPGFTWLWTEQIANYSFIWSMMMGAAVAVRTKQHFVLSILLEKLKETTAWVINIFIQGLVCFFGVLFTFYGLKLTVDFWNWSLTSLPQVTQGYFWMALPACGITITIYALFNIYELLKTKEQFFSANK